MNHTTYRSIPERVGHCLGRGWRAAARAERRASNWMVTRGAPKGFVVVLLWVAKLVAAGVMLYAAFWLALLFLFAAGAAWAASNTSTEEDEWPFTDLTELRKTPGYDPNLYNDASHEMYTDD